MYAFGCSRIMLSGVSSEGAGMTSFRTVFRSVLIGLLLLLFEPTALAQWGSLNRDKADVSTDTTEQEALADLVRFLRAHTEKDFETASEYYPPEQRAKILERLQRAGSRQNLTDKENYIRYWQLGCFTCSSPDRCRADLLLRMSQELSDIDYSRWTLGVQNNLWAPLGTDELDKDEYWRSVNSCPRQLKIPPPTIPKAPGARTDAPPKTWQEQAERADAEADARSVDEFSMGDIDF